ncbi:hypothetical protein K5I29_05000 [Flavobacterium agricola]|uniref:LETM1-like protein n=1 Tax=Flavobacterium agricola TaxID=2870839 RepID=A0ABY6M159_9FLAO|nr:LETM1-related biofilm-associated protein [Flavobacterium agricola]UYW02261.1 hypothetical protein K5I29_05000 [Flavobacterium agricola]
MNINPSANGWIAKYFATNANNPAAHLSDIALHQTIRNSGFIYGYTLNLFNLEHLSLKGLTNEELTKLALLHNLYLLYFKLEPNGSVDAFVQKLLEFYTQIHPTPKSFLNRFLPEEKNSIKLEKIIALRVATNHNFFTKSFSHLITNAFLYIDVLAFRKYLLHAINPLKYIEKIEKVVTKIAYQTLAIKTEKSKYDELFIKLFDSSMRTIKINTEEQQIEINLAYFDSVLERNYFLDIACMAVWSDAKMETDELAFIQSFAQYLEINKTQATEALDSIFYFITNYKDKIPYFNYSNPVKHFYDHTSLTVMNLIVRNKNRLVKEIMASGELVKLLAASTQRNLNNTERKKVKKQLIEICKTIPSLAIFALPGGSLLLPILIKFVPTFLPASFNENLDVLDTELPADETKK